jgi:uncharacterized YigZ family protein
MSDTEGYPVPAGRGRTDEVVRGSRFVTTLDRARTEAEAQALVEEVRAEFPDATHHCWAFVAGPPGDTARIGMSDAGEPHGTAGRPMLETLLHSGVGEVAAVVTRWFGGTKLGRGGLGRAYSGGVKQGLESLRTVKKVERVAVRIEVGYASVDPVLRLLDELEARREGEEYGAEVRIVAAVPRSALPRLHRLVADHTSGEGTVEELG